MGLRFRASSEYQGPKDGWRLNSENYFRIWRTLQTNRKLLDFCCSPLLLRKIFYMLLRGFVDIQIDSQKLRQTDRHTERQTDRQADKNTRMCPCVCARACVYMQIDKHADMQGFCIVVSSVCLISMVPYFCC